MEVLDLDFIEFKIKVSGEEMILREPSVTEQLLFEDGLKKASKDGKALYGHYIKYFIKLGGKEKLLETMALRHFVQILEKLSGSKKK